MADRSGQGAKNYVFNLQNPEGTIKAVAESAMREVMGRRNIQAVLTTERRSVAHEVQQIMQKTLNSYGAGVVMPGRAAAEGRPAAAGAGMPSAT